MPVVVIYATDNSFGRIWRQVITAMNIILLNNFIERRCSDLVGRLTRNSLDVFTIPYDA